MTKKRVAFIVADACAMLLIVTPVAYYCFYAVIRHEHFYHGLPSSRWSRVIKHWTLHKPSPPSSIPYLDLVLTSLGFRGTPAVLSRDEAAVPALLDLIWNEDDEISSLAAYALLSTRTPATLRDQWRNWGAVYAVRVQDRIVLTSSHADIAGEDSHRLVLMDGKGEFLDSLECSIQNQFTYFVNHPRTFWLELCQTPQSDGAHCIFWYHPPLPRAVVVSVHIRNGAGTETFLWDQSDSSADWEKNGLCRVAVRNAGFEILRPRLRALDH
jgi:hypothetical protein